MEGFRYRHASYADQFSQPERPPPRRRDDDEFRDPPDIRFPNRWDKDTKKNSALTQDIVKAVRETTSLPATHEATNWTVTSIERDVT